MRSLIIILITLIGVYSCKNKEKSQSTAAPASTNYALSTAAPLEEIPLSDTVNYDVAENAIQVDNKSDTEVLNYAGSWQLESWRESNQLKDIPYNSWKIQFTFSEENGNQLSIKGPCNSGGCTYELKGSELSINNNCFFTEMYCEEEKRSEREQELIQLLTRVTGIKTTDSKLLLFGPNVELSFNSL